MQKTLLITGITGLIGRSVLDELISGKYGFQISAMVRPGTIDSRLNIQHPSLNLVFLDLSDIKGLYSHLAETKYDNIIHIGALRGGRSSSREIYYKTNIEATEQLVEAALLNKSRFIYCSSVGVFGAIPEELPANNECPYKEDNYYHYTKIQCEKFINRAILKGLDAVIIRPSITYGKGDRGFPYQLVRLVRNRIFLNSNKHIWMHLCNIDTIKTAFVNLVTTKTNITGKSYNIADVEPVQQKELVSFIYRQAYNKNYPEYLRIDNRILVFGEKVARFLHNELWTSRFELIAHSWFYQVSDAYADLDLPYHFTIPDFKLITSDLQPKKK
jgi:nucleoside-diphosphate-sugar epimerase